MASTARIRAIQSPKRVGEQLTDLPRPFGVSFSARRLGLEWEYINSVTQKQNKQVGPEALTGRPWENNRILVEFPP